MTSQVTIRPATSADLEDTSRICFEAFNDISGHHNFPPDFPAIEVARGLMEMILPAAFVWGIVAEHDGRVVGSNFLWEWEPIAGVGPVTVDPLAQNLSVGRLMMEALIAARARAAIRGGAPGAGGVQHALDVALHEAGL